MRGDTSLTTRAATLLSASTGTALLLLLPARTESPRGQRPTLTSTMGPMQILTIYKQKEGLSEMQSISDSYNVVKA